MFLDVLVQALDQFVRRQGMVIADELFQGLNAIRLIRCIGRLKKAVRREYQRVPGAKGICRASLNVRPPAMPNGRSSASQLCNVHVADS